MKYLTVLHIGDIHYPEARNPLSSIDLKDRGLSDELVEVIAPRALTNVMEEVRRLLRNRNEIAGILLSGDLTSLSDIPEYHACIAYLQRCFSDLPFWSAETLHVVPGNHDVERWRVPVPGSADSGDSLDKFRGIQSAWEEAGLPILPVDSVRRADFHKGDLYLAVFSINSCMGCGEYRRLPEVFQSAYLNLLNRLRESGVADISEGTDLAGTGDDIKTVATTLAEQLDTPAFDDRHLQEITHALEETDPFSPAVILGHHGILPQSIPRIALYTEVINSGVARFRLASARNPVIYCHGHIHQDPVEVVSHPDTNGRPLVLVAAPKLEDGFNLLTFSYTSGNLILGCEVTRYTRRAYGAVQASTPIRIPLGDREAPEYSSDDVSVKIGSLLSPQYRRFQEVMKKVQQSIPAVTETEVADRLLELEWLGVVEISGAGSDAKHWHIRRRVV